VPFTGFTSGPKIKPQVLNLQASNLIAISGSLSQFPEARGNSFFHLSFSGRRPKQEWPGEEPGDGRDVYRDIGCHRKTRKHPVPSASYPFSRVSLSAIEGFTARRRQSGIGRQRGDRSAMRRCYREWPASSQTTAAPRPLLRYG
jgi:hypothetical protein